MKQILLLLLAFCLVFSVQAQQQLSSRLKVSQQLPQELLKSRSIVLIDFLQKADGREADWEAVANALHPGLRKGGVDAVAYYELSNVLSGPDATSGFLQDFQQRDIQNVVLAQVGDGVTLSVAPLGKKGLLDAGAPAWQVKAATPEAAAEALYLAASSSKLHHTNLLIPEVPELFYTTEKINIKKRMFSYPLDLKFDKLATPAYAFMKVHAADSLAALKSIMEQYPYQWGVTVPGTAEETLRMKQGYPYVLLYLHTGQKNLRRFLNYAPNEESPLELQAGPDNGQPLYKFYIRHIPTGDVYAGSSWDAAPDWQTALHKYLQGLRKDQAANLK